MTALALDLQPRFLKFIHFYLHPSFKSLITVQKKKKKQQQSDLQIIWIMHLIENNVQATY